MDPKAILRRGQLQFVQHELHERGFERTPQEVWEAIMHDAGGNVAIAFQMLESIVNDRACFDGFAITFYLR